MTRKKAPDARIIPHVRGKPVTWLTPLPPNRGPTDADVRHNTILQMKEQRFPLERGTNPAVWQNIVGRGREPTDKTNNPIRAVFRCTRHCYGAVGYSTDHRIRGPNLFSNVLTNLHRREGPTAGLYFSRPRCRGETRASDIETKVFRCGTQCRAEKVMLPDREERDKTQGNVHFGCYRCKMLFMELQKAFQEAR